MVVIGSLSYAELGTLIPKSGGEYAYLVDGLGPLHRFWGPLPAFLYSWISVLLLRPTMVAIGCLSCGSYTVRPILPSLGFCLVSENEDIITKLTVVLYIGMRKVKQFTYWFSAKISSCAGLSTSINFFSVDWTMRIQYLFTIGKLAAIVVLVGCGVYSDGILWRIMVLRWMVIILAIMI